MRQFVDADALLHGGHVILAVTKDADDWNLQAGQKPHEFLQALGIGSRATGDDANLHSAAVELRNQQ